MAASIGRAVGWLELAGRERLCGKHLGKLVTFPLNSDPDQRVTLLSRTGVIHATVILPIHMEWLANFNL